MIRIAICDDKPIFVEYFCKLLKSVFSSYEHEIDVKRFNLGVELLESIEKDDMIYDVIFLDINMPELNGFSTAKRLREYPVQSFILIFVTIMDNEIIEGYKYNAFRFILKQNLERDICEAVGKIVETLEDHSVMSEDVTFKFMHKGSSKSLSISRNDILYFEKEK